MSLVSRCPKCHQLVTIPDGLAPEAEVRCPLCVVVYPLREALAALPPALIPVESGAITEPHPRSQSRARSGLITEPYRVAESPCAGEELATTPASAPEGTFLADRWQEAEGAAEADSQLAYEAAPVIDTGRVPIEEGGARTDVDVQASQQYQPFSGGLAIRAGRKKEKGALRFLIEVFLGGVFGLTIGYYVLCWVLGPRSGLPELPLPLLPHTMHWFKGAEHPNDDTGQPSAKVPDTTRRFDFSVPAGAVPLSGGEEVSERGLRVASDQARLFEGGAASVREGAETKAFSGCRVRPQVLVL